MSQGSVTPNQNNFCAKYPNTSYGIFSLVMTGFFVGVNAAGLRLGESILSQTTPALPMPKVSEMMPSAVIGPCIPLFIISLANAANDRFDKKFLNFENAQNSLAVLATANVFLAFGGTFIHALIKNSPSTLTSHVFPTSCTTVAGTGALTIFFTAMLFSMHLALKCSQKFRDKTSSHSQTDPVKEINDLTLPEGMIAIPIDNIINPQSDKKGQKQTKQEQPSAQSTFGPDVGVTEQPTTPTLF